MILFTIAFAVGLFFVIFKLSSAVPTDGAKDVNRKVGIFEFESRVDSGFRDLGSEGRVGFVGKVGEVDDLKGESKLEDFSVEEIRDESCESRGLCEGLKSDDENEASEQVPVGSLTEKLTEEESDFNRVKFNCFASKSVDESPEMGNLDGHELDLINDQVGVGESKDIEVGVNEVKDIEVAKCGDDKEGMDGEESNGVGDEKEGLLDDEDDWEKIERTELERLFGAAVAFVGSKSNADEISVLSNELKMKLYGLHMIATQGPCLEPPPMALKVSSRAKWSKDKAYGNTEFKLKKAKVYNNSGNERVVLLDLIDGRNYHFERNACQELGEMSRETAMELYILILSRKIPECTPEKEEFAVFPKGQVSAKVASFLKTEIQNQPEVEAKENLNN